MSIQSQATGVFTAADLNDAIKSGIISLGAAQSSTQVQPASLDLTLGARAWRVRSAFLPGRDRLVRDRLDGLALHELNLADGAVLEKGCVYVVELRERLALPGTHRARANPKSSTGRIDVFVRLVVDGGEAYETVEPGYDGPLYAEISPRTFSILVREGSSLNQLRVLNAETQSLTDEALEQRQQSVGLIKAHRYQIRNGLCMSVDLSDGFGGVVGYRARRHSGLIDVDKVGQLVPEEYWEPIHAPKDGTIILDPGEFYILASREELRIPKDLAAEMMPIDTELGAFRAHYAGFFDPGFGVDAGSRAVLEVRGYDAPFLIEHGQTIARLTFEPLTRMPDATYGAQLKSNYQGQSLRLSKHFRQTATCA